MGRPGRSDSADRRRAQDHYRTASRASALRARDLAGDNHLAVRLAADMTNRIAGPQSVPAPAYITLEELAAYANLSVRTLEVR